MAVRTAGASGAGNGSRRVNASGEGPRRRSLVEWLEQRLGPAGAPLIRQIQLEHPGRREKVRLRIDAAGRPGGLTVERYARRKGAFLVLGLGLLGMVLASVFVRYRYANALTNLRHEPLFGKILTTRVRRFISSL